MERGLLHCASTGQRSPRSTFSTRTPSSAPPRAPHDVAGLDAYYYPRIAADLGARSLLVRPRARYGQGRREVHLHQVNSVKLRTRATLLPEPGSRPTRVRCPWPTDRAGAELKRRTIHAISPGLRMQPAPLVAAHGGHPDRRPHLVIGATSDAQTDARQVATAPLSHGLPPGLISAAPACRSWGTLRRYAGRVGCQADWRVPG
jgi:hypothetical protein